MTTTSHAPSAWAGTLSLIAIIVLSTQPASAQRINGGLKAGISSTTFVGQADTQFNPRQAFSAGVSFGVQLTPFLLVQPEVLYVIKGADADNIILEGEETNLEATFSLAYLEIPILLVFRPRVSSNTHLRLFAGPSVGSNLDSRVETRNPVTGSVLRESDSSITDYDYGAVFGAGVDRSAFGEVITVDLRWLLGVPDIRDRPDAPLRNRGLLLMFGVSF